MNLKSMPEEEELDSMFRQAADSFQPEFDSEAWREMEKKLDAANRPKPAIGTWMKRSVLVLLLLVFGWLVYRFAGRESNFNRTEQTEILAEKPGVVTKPEKIATEKLNSNSNQSQISSSPENNRASAAFDGKEKTDRLTQITGRVNQSGTKQPFPARAAAYPAKTTRINRIGAVLNNSNQKNNNGLTDSSKLEISVLNSLNKEQSADTIANVSEPLKSKQNVAVDSINLKTDVVQNQKLLLDSARLQAVADSAIQKTRKRFLAKLGITLVLGPDFSRVGSVKPEKASTNVGVLISYQVGNRWTIATGLVRARKVYGAKPEDYHPDSAYWQPGHVPDDIRAICKVIDIPLNVRYAFLTLPTHVAYVQTGLSSYIMLHEDYRYNYNYGSRPYSKKVIIANQNRHFFQVLNLSAGYCRQIAPGISLGAEPFVKIPLAGIGAGKVNLTSMGIFFNVGYNFR